MQTNNITLFSHPQLGEIRVQQINGEPWFVGKDVAEVLGYERPDNAIRNHVEAEDKLMHQISASGQNRNMHLINESGLYALILSSKLPQAKEFKRWVTSEVLPQIRKTGGYIPLSGSSNGSNGSSGSSGVSDQEILCRALLILKKTIDLKDELLEAQRPKVEFANAISGSEDSILIRDLAKLITQNGYKIGQTRLFYWLRLHGYLFQNETRPIQKWVEKGLFEIVENGISTHHHGTQIKITTRVTPKGQQYFLDGFMSGRFKAGNVDFINS